MTEEACAHTLTCSAASADSPLPQDGPDTRPSDSVKSTNGASAFFESTGQMSLFGETCEDSVPLTLSALWPTPVGNDDNKSIEAYTRMKKGMAGADRKTVTSLNVAIKAGLSPSSPPATPASHSQSPGSDWARKMTATYGRKLGDYWLSSDPPDSWLRTLLGTSIWASMTCWLTWKKSATPHGRLLFRLVPWAPRTAGIGSGLLRPTPWASDADTSPTDTIRHASLSAQINRERMWPTPNVNSPNNRAEYPSSGGDGLAIAAKRAEGLLRDSNGMKLNSAWVSRMMGYPDDWLTLDGEETP